MKTTKKLIAVMSIGTILASTAVVGNFINASAKSSNIIGGNYVVENKVFSNIKDGNLITAYGASYAPEELDKLYAEGVNAVIRCQNENTQGSINEARACIGKFKGKLDWAVGEFSKQVDKIQNPILASIVDGINRNQKQPVQKDINIIRKNILALPREDWKSCYSSALDKAQQILIKQANNKSLEVNTNAQNSVNNIANNTEAKVSQKTTENISQKTTQNKSENIAQNNGQVNNIAKDKVTPKEVTKEETQVNDKFMKEVETIILQKVNEERRKAGLGELKYNSVMEKYARIKSQDMGDRNYFDHRDLQGNLITVRMQQDGVNYNAWGENIAYIGGGNSDAQSLANQFMNMWMNSPGHRANILSTNFNSMGVGVYKIGSKIYATQEFYR